MHAWPALSPAQALPGQHAAYHNTVHMQPLPCSAAAAAAVASAASPTDTASLGNLDSHCACMAWTDCALLCDSSESGHLKLACCPAHLPGSTCLSHQSTEVHEHLESESTGVARSGNGGHGTVDSYTGASGAKYRQPDRLLPGSAAHGTVQQCALAAAHPGGQACCWRAYQETRRHTTC